MSARKPKPKTVTVPVAAHLKHRLAELLIEIDQVQLAACEAQATAEGSLVDDIIVTTDAVAAELARLLLPPDLVAAELRAAQAGIAVNAPGLWHALGQVAAHFGDGAVGGRGIKVTDPAMADATLAIARSTAAIDHPTGTCCEGDGTFLRIRSDGAVASWTDVALRVMRTFISAPRAAVKVARR